ncbi:TetR/AcrR family transcriptional regulator [Streptomyces sp. PTM05]|uniref:TetR/AcrR family transcriptional regulator n=1 Tax=Streptantibioticus parmotrematis TaxID=2873249 RepID=A0ABS7QPL1_9ACTN|nr:TetR/AcrR family transcriptional regulator [Streptantibioticus parmotrematis]MBY8885126.1 TetR/AcrR family transcriptional regulator [Streptantibioticus parmotrematis]
MPPRQAPQQVDGRKTRWEGQHERRRTEFVDAAITAIARFGPEVSTQQIADEAGVARTRLYKHFADAGDLQRAVAARAAESVTAALQPLWRPRGTPMEMITNAVGAYVGWLRENIHLYRYLSRHTGTMDAVADIKTAIGAHLSGLFAGYLTALDGDPRAAEPLGFGIVGFVDTASVRWVDHADGLGHEELTAQLARWIWCVLDETLRASGLSLDPHQPLDLEHPAAATEQATNS